MGFFLNQICRFVLAKLPACKLYHDLTGMKHLTIFTAEADNDHNLMPETGINKESSL